MKTALAAFAALALALPAAAAVVPGEWKVTGADEITLVDFSELRERAGPARIYRVCLSKESAELRVWSPRGEKFARQLRHNHAPCVDVPLLAGEQLNVRASAAGAEGTYQRVE
jgi:hypothetical protein